MKLDAYQREALATAQYPSLGSNIVYPALGLGEVGELANDVKKVYRDDDGRVSIERRDRLRFEAGDLLWYCASTAAENGLLLSEATQVQTFTELAEQPIPDLKHDPNLNLQGLSYVTLKMMGYVGYLALATTRRMDDPQQFEPSATDHRREIAHNLRCLLIYLSQFLGLLDLSLEEVAQANLDKLAARAERGTIGGSGEDR